MEKFFTDTGAFLHTAFNRVSHRTKMFEVVYAALPRYFLSQFSTEVENLQITLDGASELVVNNETKVTCDRAKFTYTYRNQCQVTTTLLYFAPALINIGCVSWQAHGFLDCRKHQNGMATIRDAGASPNDTTRRFGIAVFARRDQPAKSDAIASYE